MGIGLRFGLLVLIGLFSLGSHAQSPAYPGKPVRVVVPYPPGGVTDITGRLMADELGKRLGQPFVVENRGGAGGRIGADAVAKAAPDGYTLLIGTPGPLITLAALSPKMPYDVERDFDPIGHLVTMPNIMVVNPKSQFTSLDALIAYARGNPGRVRYGSAGIGASGHVAGALLSSLTDIQMQHVPYRGSGPALADLMAGEIDVIFDGLPSALPHIRSGKLRGVALLSPKRANAAPEFTTTAELGHPQFAIGSGTGLLGPKGLPGDVIAQLEKALKAIAEDPESARRFMAQGTEIDYMNAAQYATFIRNEIGRTRVFGQKSKMVLE